MAEVFPQPVDLPSGSQPWARKVTENVQANTADIANNKQDVLNTTKGLQGSLDALSKQINALPVPVAQSTTTQPTSATSSTFTTKAIATVMVPQGKSTATLSLFASVALLDTVTGGVAAPPYVRFLVNGTSILPIAAGVPATKDSGASQVNNVVSFASVYTSGVAGQTSIQVELQIAVFHATAYATNTAANFATVAVQGMFS